MECLTCLITRNKHTNLNKLSKSPNNCDHEGFYQPFPKNVFPTYRKNGDIIQECVSQIDIPYFRTANREGGRSIIN